METTTTRGCPPALEARYRAACADAGSDIHEHLPLLRELAERCEHVTEFGLRWGNGSTIAFLAAQPETFVSWDISPRAVISQPVADLISEAEGSRTSFQPRVGNVLDVTIELTDLLFIDTYHVYRQLNAELAQHGERARQFLVMHDTITFGEKGEDGTTPGLRWAIRNFMLNHFPRWYVRANLENNNGLVVLERP